MELYLNSPAYYSVKFGIDDEIYNMCRELSNYVKDKEYSPTVAIIGITFVVAPKEYTEQGKWKEETRYLSKGKVVTAFKQIDYDLYCQADIESRKILIAKSILECTKSLHKKAKFNYKEFEKDVNCFFESQNNSGIILSECSINELNVFNKYIFLDYDDEQYFIETNYEGYALRQITIDENGTSKISCVVECLAEGNVIELLDNIDEKYICKEDFEDVWYGETEKIRVKWESYKKTLSLGMTLTGAILYHYPQGWIISVCDNFGVLKSKKSFSVGQIISGVVVGFDEANMWVVLKK